MSTDHQIVVTDISCVFYDAHFLAGKTVAIGETEELGPEKRT